MQDRWNIDRLTVSAGLRIDWFYSENPEFQLGTSLLTPNRNYTVPKFSTTQYKDWTPKVAAAYDLFGDGRTALKVNYGKYVLGQALVVGGLAAQPGYNVQLTSSRGWVDNNRNFIPDCDLANPLAQGPTLTGAQNQIDTCNAPAGVNAELLRQRAAAQPRRAGRCPLRVGQAAVQLGVRRRRAARAEPGAVGHRRRVLAVVRQLPGDRQHVRHRGRLRAVLRNARSSSRLAPASAGGESLPDDINTGGFFAINPGVAGEQRDRAVHDHVPGQQRLRPLVRLRPDGQHAAGRRADLAGRPEHRPPDHGLLRRAGSGQGRQQRAGGDADERQRPRVADNVSHGAEAGCRR